MSRFRRWYNKHYRNRLKRLSIRLYWKKKEQTMLSKLQENSHSLRWVWEFSKKAVLICFLYYMIVQAYAMVVMVVYCDFTYLGELINKTGELVENCVFMYLVKAGIENVGKMLYSRKHEEIDKIDESNPDEPVG